MAIQKVHLPQLECAGQLVCAPGPGAPAARGPTAAAAQLLARPRRSAVAALPRLPLLHLYQTCSLLQVPHAAREVQDHSGPLQVAGLILLYQQQRLHSCGGAGTRQVAHWAPLQAPRLAPEMEKLPGQPPRQ
jgi:hypothetical protein